MAQSRPVVESSMSPPLAFLLTWTTYGAWLPGDPRGWVEKGRGRQAADPRRHAAAQRLLSESPCTLDQEQRRVVDNTIVAHCRIRGWPLRAVNCRTNHVHVVVTANTRPDEVMRQLKAWTSRRLRERDANRGVPSRKNWWTERGSRRWINDEASLEASIHYVLHAQ